MILFEFIMLVEGRFSWFAFRCVLDRRTRRTDLLVDADEGTIEPESSQVMAEYNDLDAQQISGRSIPGRMAKRHYWRTIVLAS